jgi:hypothetical protein
MNKLLVVWLTSLSKNHYAKMYIRLRAGQVLFLLFQLILLGSYRLSFSKLCSVPDKKTENSSSLTVDHSLRLISEVQLLDFPLWILNSKGRVDQRWILGTPETPHQPINCTDRSSISFYYDQHNLPADARGIVVYPFDTNSRELDERVAFAKSRNMTLIGLATESDCMYPHLSNGTWQKVYPYLDYFVGTSPRHDIRTVIGLSDQYLGYRGHPGYDVYSMDDVIPFQQRKPRILFLYASFCEKRRHFAEELNRFLPVDAPGRCYHNVDGLLNETQFLYESWTPKLDLMRHYMFVVTAENIECDGYISEKIYQALRFNVIPLHFAHQSYRRAVPCTSCFIDLSGNITSIGENLQRISQSSKLFDEFWSWKQESPPTYWKTFTQFSMDRALCNAIQYPNITQPY